MSWQETLEKQGFVQLENFLCSKLANQLLKGLKNNSHPQAWRLLTRPNGPNQSIKDCTLKFTNVKTANKQARTAHQRNQFAFSFWRSSNRYIEQNKMKPIIETFKASLLNRIEDQLVDSPSLRDCFAAKFNNNQFIGYHTDGSAGKYAFIYQLSKSWKPRYGGQLILYPNKSKFYRKYLVPKFNTLSLLKLDHPMPHSVKMLKTPLHTQRYTISGWVN